MSHENRPPQPPADETGVMRLFDECRSEIVATLQHARTLTVRLAPLRVELDEEFDRVEDNVESNCQYLWMRDLDYAASA